MTLRWDLARWNAGVRRSLDADHMRFYVEGASREERDRAQREHAALPAQIAATRDLHALDADGICGECMRRATFSGALDPHHAPDAAPVSPGQSGGRGT